MDEARGRAALAALDQLLERLLRVVQAPSGQGLEREATRYVEAAIEAAMTASGRARDGGLPAPAAEHIAETLAVAERLLGELRSSQRRAWAIVDQSLELRRRAIGLTAWSVRVGAGEVAAAAGTGGGAERPDLLHRVRILLIGHLDAAGRRFQTLLSALGAEVHAVPSPAQATAAGRTFHPDALICFLPFPAAEALICELRREGVIAPALAVAELDDSATRAAGRMSGFFDILAPGASLSTLVRAVRTAIGD